MMEQFAHLSTKCKEQFGIS